MVGEESLLTLDGLVDRCEEWQERLELLHWRVSVCLARMSDMPLKEAQGTCTIVAATRIAKIEILDPVDYPTGPFKYDMEQTLVHELLHLHFSPFMEEREGDYAVWLAQEQAIETIARVLVCSHRASDGIGGRKHNG